MTQLAANAGRSVKAGDLHDHPVLTAVKIYEGSAVGLQLSSGYARQLVCVTDLDRFLGFAQEEADNTLGGNGAIKVPTLARGRVPLVVTGVDGVNDLRKPVYASDGATFTLTQADDTVFIGYVVEHVSGTTCFVEFDANHNPHLTAIADAVETITGLANNADVATLVTLKTEHEALALKVNAILVALRNAGFITANT
ncbi:MAG: hypothetical protein AB7T38_02505 [Nitrospirales bacterium]